MANGITLLATLSTVTALTAAAVDFSPVAVGLTPGGDDKLARLTGAFEPGVSAQRAAPASPPSAPERFVMHESIGGMMSFRREMRPAPF